MKRRKRFAERVASIGLGLGAALPGWCASLLPVNLPQMVDQADRIFVGRAVGEWTGRDERGIPATITTFEVNRTLKGRTQAVVTLKQLGVTEIQPDGLAAWIEGMPRYRKGLEYLMFLNPDSSIGFSSPVGAFQGAFEVRRAESGKAAAVNGIDNHNLLRGIDPETRVRLGLVPETFSFVSRGRGPIHLDELVAMIQRLQEREGEVSR